MLRAYSRAAKNDPIPTNGSTPSKIVENVSDTNALPTSSTGAQDHSLKEPPSEGEQRVMQAPNRASTWSRSQQPRSKAMVGPRFEQTVLEDQVR
jgi:NADH dehydrogenase (ubiquinone) Fe-S protein 6